VKLKLQLPIEMIVNSVEGLPSTELMRIIVINSRETILTVNIILQQTRRGGYGSSNPHIMR